MMSATPAAALREHGPVLDSEALRRTEQWRGCNRPGGRAGWVGAARRAARAVDLADLPAEIRWSLDVIKTMSGLLTDVQRPEWDGRVAP